MARRSNLILLVMMTAFVWLFAFDKVEAQSFGIELHNSMMPASGGMAGASIASPRDLQSAMNANPAALAGFRGTQFSLGGGWAEATYNIDQQSDLPLVGVLPFAAKSGTPGSTVPNIGVTQDLRELGFPVTVGMGLLTNAGAGVDFRNVPESNGTSAEYLALDFVASAAMSLTDTFAIGGSLFLGNSYLDGPFVDSGGMTGAYGFRGSVGVQWWARPDTAVGAYWQSKKSFNFQDAFVLNRDTVRDVNFDHPPNIGIGVANNSLMDGRLLVATDFIYKLHQEADFLRAIYRNQFVFLLGTEYVLSPRVRLRSGYGFNQNPMRDAQGITVGGVELPDGVPALRYVQGQFAAVSQHRITGGFGIQDVLPGLDFDFFAGGAFKGRDQFASTVASVESYWIGLGTTWRFGPPYSPSCTSFDFGSSCSLCP